MHKKLREKKKNMEPTDETSSSKLNLREASTFFL